MSKAGFEIIFNQQGVIIYKLSITILTACESNDIKLRLNYDKTAYNAVALKNDYTLWHQKLSYTSYSKFMRLKSKRRVDDNYLSKNVKPNHTLCESCIVGKTTRLPSGHRDKDYIKISLYVHPRHFVSFRLERRLLFC